MKLTKTAIDSFVYEGKTAKAKDIRWDDELSGFGVRVFPSGKKAFVLSYRHRRRQRLMTLGPYGVLTLHLARELARTKLADVIRGQDPLAEKQSAAAQSTVAEFSKDYVAKYAKRQTTGAQMVRRIEKYVVPAIGGLKLVAVTRRDVVKLHDRLKEKTPILANRIVALISSMYSRAALWGDVPEGHPNPAHGVELAPEVKRDRFVTHEEMPRLARAIDEEPGVYAKALIWLYLLTGLRKSELLRVQWADIDFTRRELRIANTKAGRLKGEVKPHYVPLSAWAIEILKAVPRLKKNPYVFCGVKEGSHLYDIKGPWDRVRERAKIEDVRLHDLRRTVGSWLAMSGESLPLIGRVLNHSNASTTQIYARFHSDPVAQALEEHSEKLRGINAQPRLTSG